MTKTFGLLGLAIALFLPRAVAAQGSEPQMLSITGRVAADQQAAAQFGLSGVSIGFTGASPDKLVWVGVVKAESWNDDVFAGRDMLAAVQGFTPALIATGKPALLTKIQQAPVGSRIVIEGIFDKGERSYVPGMVEVSPPGGSK